MKLAMKNGELFIADFSESQAPAIKSLPGIKYCKSGGYWHVPVNADTLDRLSKSYKLPDEIEAHMRFLKRQQAAIDFERMADAPKPLVRYPVKAKLYNHQIRGANMALLALGLVEAGETV